MNNTTRQPKKKNTLLWILIAAVIAMFFFGYAMVPLYNVLCDALGINGKTNATGINNTSLIDRSRTVTVQFMATSNANLPWTFRPNKTQVDLHPGQDIQISYFAKNNSNKEMTVQAIPSVTPTLAAAHLKKTECFCFNQQTLKPGQSMNMPIIFHIDNNMPKNIHELTLSYALYATPKQKKPSKKAGRIS